MMTATELEHLPAITGWVMPLDSPTYGFEVGHVDCAPDFELYPEGDDPRVAWARADDDPCARCGGSLRIGPPRMSGGVR